MRALPVEKKGSTSWREKESTWASRGASNFGNCWAKLGLCCILPLFSKNASCSTIAALPASLRYVTATGPGPAEGPSSQPNAAESLLVGHLLELSQKASLLRIDMVMHSRAALRCSDLRSAEQQVCAPAGQGGKSWQVHPWAAWAAWAACRGCCRSCRLTWQRLCLQLKNAVPQSHVTDCKSVRRAWRPHCAFRPKCCDPLRAYTFRLPSQEVFLDKATADGQGLVPGIR